MKNLRILLILFLALFIIFISYSVFSPEEDLNSFKKDIKGMSLQEKFEYTEILGGKKKYTAEAERYFVDKKGYIYLSGNINVNIFSSGFILRANKCRVNRSKKRYEFSGDVVLKGKEEETRTKEAIYFPKDGVVLIKAPLHFKRAKIEGNAKRARVLLKEKEAIFIEPSFRFGKGTRLKGRRFDLDKKSNQGILKGNPAIVSKGEKLMKGTVLELFLKGDEVEKVNASSGGKVILKKGDFLKAAQYSFTSEGFIKAKRASLSKGKIRIGADEILIKEKIKARGNVRIIQGSARIKAEEAELKDNTILLKKDISIVKGKTALEGESARISNDGREIFIENGTYSSGGIALSAEKIVVKGKNLEAKGKVEGKKKNTVLKCEKLIKKGEEETVEGSIKVLREGNLIKGEKVIMKGENYEIIHGNILTGGGYSIKGDSIIYSNSRIEVKNNVSIDGEDISLTSSSASVVLNKGKMEELRAEGVEKLNIKGSEGKASSLKYDFTKKIAVLEGKASINSEKQGELEGEKIIFYLNEDRFEVSGKGRTTSKLKGKK